MSMDTEERIAESAPLSSRHAWGLLVLIVVLWGISWPVMKYGLHYVPPLTFGALRMTLGTMIISVAAAACGQWRVPLREDWPLVLAVGLLQMAAFTGLVQIGLQYVPAGRSSILAYTTPLWVLPLAVWRLREPLTRLRLLGVRRTHPLARGAQRPVQRVELADRLADSREVADCYVEQWERFALRRQPAPLTA